MIEIATLKEFIKKDYPCVNCVTLATCLHRPLDKECYQLLDFLIKEKKDEQLFVKSTIRSDTCGNVISWRIYSYDKQIVWINDCRYCGGCEHWKGL